MSHQKALEQLKHQLQGELHCDDLMRKLYATDASVYRKLPLAVAIPKNRVMYVLTPKGAAEKTRLTYLYIRYSYHFYKGARQKLRRTFEELTELGVRRVVFYGANDLAEIAFISLQETPIKLTAVVDDLKVGKNFLGGVVADPAELGSLSYDRIVITADDDSAEDILGRISAKGISRSKAVMLQ